MMDARVIKPANEAMEYIQPLKKTIKKRDNKRLDWERYQDRVINYQRKTNRSDRENAALAKAEEELGVAAAVCVPRCYFWSKALVVQKQRSGRRPDFLCVNVFADQIRLLELPMSICKIPSLLSSLLPSQSGLIYLLSR